MRMEINPYETSITKCREQLILFRDVGFGPKVKVVYYGGLYHVLTRIHDEKGVRRFAVLPLWEKLQVYDPCPDRCQPADS